MRDSGGGRRQACRPTPRSLQDLYVRPCPLPIVSILGSDMEAWLSKVTWSHGPIWPKLSVAMHYLHAWFCLFSYYITIITIQEICQWAETDPGKRNFIGGEKVLNADHDLRKTKNDYDVNNIELFASCIRSLGTTTNEPHKIHGQISRKSAIMNFECSSKAGKGERCKHVLATLQYCHS